MKGENTILYILFLVQMKGDNTIFCILFRLQMKGEAEAFAIEARAKAEAEQMAKKADAWKDYQDAAMVDMVLETLPKVC